MTVLEARPWTRRAACVAMLVAAACAIPTAELLAATTALAVATLVVAAGARWLPGCTWAAVLLPSAVLLPAADRESWRAEVRAVLHAAGGGPERRHQVRGFLIGLPACAVTCWSLALRRR